MFAKTETAKPIMSKGHLIWCKEGTPYVPTTLRRLLYDTFHGLNHPGPNATAKKMAEHYYWPGMVQQITEWATECDICQRVKKKKRILPKMDNRPVTYEKFQDIQMTVVGPYHWCCHEPIGCPADDCEEVSVAFALR